MPHTNLKPFIPIALRDLTSRANRLPPERRASEFMTARQAGKRGGGPKPILTPPNPPQTVPDDNEDVSEEELVRRYMANLGEPLTQEQWDEMQAQMRELEKLPLEEVLRRHKEALGDLF